MKKLPKMRIKNSISHSREGGNPEFSRHFRFPIKSGMTINFQSGFAPIIAVIASGFFLAIAIFMVSTRTFTFNSPLTPNPSPASFDDIEISAPVPVDPSDEACDDEYNFDCDDLEGDDVDPADLAGPD